MHKGRKRLRASRSRGLLRPRYVGPGALALLAAIAVAPTASSRPLVKAGVVIGGLQGVDCVSGADCWAVGDSTNKTGALLNEATHWNGKRWKVSTTPQPSESADSQRLLSVSCLSASDCWAVGIYKNQAGALLNQAMDWNGKRWKLVATPQPVGAASANDSQGLSGVSCVSASDCWGVGASDVTGDPGANEVMRWNGRKWKTGEAPTPARRPGEVQDSIAKVQKVLRSVACLNASDCWAVGTTMKASGADLNQTLHWTGKQWRAVSAPSPGQPSAMESRQLPDITCPSARVCSAVGYYPTKAGAVVNEALRFNGKRWGVMSTPDPGGTSDSDFNELGGVACMAATDCWAVGYFTSSSDGVRNEALHWNGKKWTQLATPDPGGEGATAGNRLEAVACASANDCWAVGGIRKTKGFADQMLHWNGKRWSG